MEKKSTKTKSASIGVRVNPVQREVLERLINNDVFPDMSMSSYIIFLIQLRAHDVLGWDFQEDNLDFDCLLELFKQAEVDKFERLKNFIIPEQRDEFEKLYFNVKNKYNKEEK